MIGPDCVPLLPFEVATNGGKGKSKSIPLELIGKGHHKKLLTMTKGRIPVPSREDLFMGSSFLGSSKLEIDFLAHDGIFYWKKK